MSAARLEAALADCAKARRSVTYGALAAEIGLDGPGRIARLTTFLEALMEVDAAAGRPLRAALVIGRSSGGLPARGFFLKAQALGYDVSDAAAFVAHESERVFTELM
ncbi:MAG: hypothetical protein EA339_12725 [Rhodobacteraceae bacterium]|nr:MAG: hypothetical protein EA339_12725 [Paracoccaceae bacterium]